MQNIATILSGQQGLAGVQHFLTAAAQEQIQAALRPHLTGSTAVRACHLQRAKFKPGRKLTASYDLHYQSADGAGAASRPLSVTWSLTDSGAKAPPEQQTVQAEANRRGLADPFQQLALTVPQTGMKIQIAPSDPHYPQLVRLTDPRYVRDCLGSSAQSTASVWPATAADYKVTPVRYRPGQRHVLRYDPLTTTSPAPGTVFAKLYPDPAGAELATRINQMADWLAAHTADVRILRPQAYLHEEKTLLYPWAKGVPLAQLLATGGCIVAALLQQVGVALRLLHSAPSATIQGLPVHTLAAEVKGITRTCEHIQLLLPAAGQKIQALLAQAQACYTTLPAEAPTFVYGDCKADHVLVASQTEPAPLTLIDFDTCALADPALDIGKFLADLTWWYTTQQRAGLTHAQNAFLAGYNLSSTHPRLRRAQVWAALIGIKMTAHRVPLFDRTWGVQTSGLLQQYERVLLG